jgi:hypothetical protein
LPFVLMYDSSFAFVLDDSHPTLSIWNVRP